MWHFKLFIIRCLNVTVILKIKSFFLAVPGQVELPVCIIKNAIK